MIFSDDEPRFHKAQLLGGREKTSENVKNNLKERLSKQVDEKRASMQIEKDDVSAIVSGKFQKLNGKKFCLFSTLMLIG